jgi:endoglucanase
MTRSRKILVAIAAIAAVAVPGAALSLRNNGEPASPQDDPAAAAAKSLGRGVNFAALEAPNEGQWGTRLSATWFARAKEAGFATVRLPVRWSNHAAATAPYAIDEEFFQRSTSRSTRRAHVACESS